MKDYFKYQFGYINIDDTNLYMTSSGNWSEIKELTEKTNKSKLNNRTRVLTNWIFIIFVIGGLGIAYLSGILKGQPGLFALIGTPILVYYFYKYLQRDLGNKYSIPIFKITKIEFSNENKDALIYFLDGDHNNNKEVINNIGSKGYEILSKLVINNSMDAQTPHY